MSIGSSDFVGAASLLSGLGRAVSAAGSHQNSQQRDEPVSAVTPEAILECLEQLNTASADRLAEAFKEMPEALQPHIAKLVDLRFVAQEGEGQGATYALTDLGRRARKLAQIAQSAS